MARTLTATATVTARALLQSAANIGTCQPQDAPESATSISLASGTGAGQADQVYAATRTLAGSTAEDLDLAGTTLTNGVGETISFARVKLIKIVHQTPAATGVLKIGGDGNGLVNWVASNTDIIQIRPGGTFFLSATDATAYAVTAGTGDILQVENADAAPISYDILIVGVKS